MAAATKLSATLVLSAERVDCVKFTTEEPCLLEFTDEDVFHRRFVILQAGSTLVPYFGGHTKCYLYNLRDLEPLADLPGTKKAPYDVPTP